MPIFGLTVTNWHRRALRLLYRYKPLVQSTLAFALSYWWYNIFAFLFSALLAWLVVELVPADMFDRYYFLSKVREKRVMAQFVIWVLLFGARCFIQFIQWTCGNTSQPALIMKPAPHFEWVPFLALTCLDQDLRQRSITTSPWASQPGWHAEKTPIARSPSDTETSTLPFPQVYSASIPLTQFEPPVFTPQTRIKREKFAVASSKAVAKNAKVHKAVSKSGRRHGPRPFVNVKRDPEELERLRRYVDVCVTEGQNLRSTEPGQTTDKLRPWANSKLDTFTPISDCSRLSQSSTSDPFFDGDTSQTERGTIKPESPQVSVWDRLRQTPKSLYSFARIRPLTAQESTSHPSLLDVEVGHDGIKVTTGKMDSRGLASVESTYLFSLDHCFSSSSDNTQISRQLRPMMYDTLERGELCVIVDGQSGTGKSYTMLEGDSAVARAAALELFSLVHALGVQDYEWTVRCSIVEIYLNQQRDLLLGPKGIVSQGPAKKAKSAATSQPVASADAFHRLLREKLENRVVDRTALNSASSRGHLVCTLTLEIDKAVKGFRSQRQIRATLVDLAGKERVDSVAEHTKAREELVAINTSRSALHQAMRRAGSKGTDFRTCKLTALLRHAITSASATIILLSHINPLDEHSHMSIETLRFAEEVSRAMNQA